MNPNNNNVILVNQSPPKVNINNNNNNNNPPQQQQFPPPPIISSPPQFIYPTTTTNNNFPYQQQQPQTMMTTSFIQPPPPQPQVQYVYSNPQPQYRYVVPVQHHHQQQQFQQVTVPQSSNRLQKSDIGNGNNNIRSGRVMLGSKDMELKESLFNEILKDLILESLISEFEKKSREKVFKSVLFRLHGEMIHEFLEEIIRALMKESVRELNHEYFVRQNYEFHDLYGLDLEKRIAMGKFQSGNPQIRRQKSSRASSRRGGNRRLRSGRKSSERRNELLMAMVRVEDFSEEKISKIVFCYDYLVKGIVKELIFDCIREINAGYLYCSKVSRYGFGFDDSESITEILDEEEKSKYDGKELSREDVNEIIQKLEKDIENLKSSKEVEMQKIDEEVRIAIDGVMSRKRRSIYSLGSFHFKKAVEEERKVEKGDKIKGEVIKSMEADVYIRKITFEGFGDGWNEEISESNEIRKKDKEILTDEEEDDDEDEEEDEEIVVDDFDEIEIKNASRQEVHKEEENGGLSNVTKKFLQASFFKKIAYNGFGN